MQREPLVALLKNEETALILDVIVTHLKDKEIQKEGTLIFVISFGLENLFLPKLIILTVQEVHPIEYV
jgi:L-cystine uptake protein TcyP (sodium:dicarboxylate symporter family)